LVFGCFIFYVCTALNAADSGATVPVSASVSVSEPAYGSESRSNQIFLSFYFSSHKYLNTGVIIYYIVSVLINYFKGLYI